MLINKHSWVNRNKMNHIFLKFYRKILWGQLQLKEILNYLFFLRSSAKELVFNENKGKDFFVLK